MADPHGRKADSLTARPWIFIQAQRQAVDMEKWITGQEILDQWSVHPQELVLICWSHKVNVYHPKTLDLIDIEGLAGSWFYHTAATMRSSASLEDDDVNKEVDPFDYFCSEFSKSIVPSSDPLSKDEREKMLYDLPIFLFPIDKIKEVEERIIHNGGFGFQINIYQAFAIGHRWPMMPRPETPEEFVAKCRAQGTKDDHELARFVDNFFCMESGKYRRLSDLEMGKLLPADPDRTDISPGSQRDRGKRLRRKKK